MSAVKSLGRVLMMLFALPLLYFATTYAPEPRLPPSEGLSVTGHPALGCWVVTPRSNGDWYFDGPTRMRLTDSVTRVPGYPAIVFDSVFLMAKHIRRQFWSPVRSGARIFLYWGTGNIGVGLTMTQRGDSMTGRSLRTSDVMWTMRGPPVVAARTACP